MNTKKKIHLKYTLANGDYEENWNSHKPFPYLINNERDEKKRKDSETISTVNEMETHRLGSVLMMKVS